MAEKIMAKKGKCVRLKRCCKCHERTRGNLLPLIAFLAGGYAAASYGGDKGRFFDLALAIAKNKGRRY